MLFFANCSNITKSTVTIIVLIIKKTLEYTFQSIEQNQQIYIQIVKQLD